MGAILTFFAGPLGRWLIIALLMVGAAAAGAAKMHAHDNIALEASEAKYNKFEGGVAALGTQAKKDAEAKRLKGIKDKEDADAENARDAAVVDAELARLRQLAAERNSGGGSMSAAPAGSKCPDGQTCFDSAQYRSAMGTADTGARRLAGEGTSVTTDLNTAKRWAQKLPAQ